VDPAVVAAMVSLARAMFINVDDPADERVAMVTVDQVAQIVLLARAAGVVDLAHAKVIDLFALAAQVHAVGEPVTAASLAAAEGLRRFAGQLGQVGNAARTLKRGGWRALRDQVRQEATELLAEAVAPPLAGRSPTPTWACWSTSPGGPNRPNEPPAAARSSAPT
jgi:hypothetical protein